VSIVLKSGSLNLLEPSGPVQVCNGIALPLLSHIWTTLHGRDVLRYRKYSIREKTHHKGKTSHNASEL